MKETLENIFEWTKGSQGPREVEKKVFILEPSNVIHQAVKFNGSFLALTINIQRFCRQKRVVVEIKVYGFTLLLTTC